MNKIALFTISPFSLTSLLIAAVTRCPFSHAAICVDGVWYHASESTGQFSTVDVSKFKNRHCTVYQFDGDLTAWLPLMLGKEYDWKGILGWAKRLVGLKYTANDRKFYCFEAAMALLMLARKDHLLHDEIYGELDANLNKKMGLTNFLSTRLLVGGRQGESARFFAVCKELTKEPITGCDIAELFPVGRSGRFGDLL